MVQLNEWQGLLEDSRRVDSADTNLVMFIEKSTRGNSGAFKGLCGDSQKYWIKPINNNQGQLVPITEQIVGRVATLIEAATCNVKTVKISEDFVGHEFKQGKKIEAGIAHGSLNVDDVVDVGGLEYRNNDDNQRRHATIFAIYDWCWGGDMQGLCKATEDFQFFSHDHGWYLPPTGQSWDIQSLQSVVDVPHELNHQPIGGIPPIIVNDVVQALEAVTRDQLIKALSCIPSSWPVTNEQLETVGWFLESRIPGVVQRMRRLFGVLI